MGLHAQGLQTNVTVTRSGGQTNIVLVRQMGTVLCADFVWPEGLDQGFPNMPFVKCLSGFAEAPYQAPPSSPPWFPKSAKEKTHKHKQICGIVPGLGGRQYFVYACFSGQSLWGRKTHKQSPPPCFIRSQPRTPKNKSKEAYLERAPSEGTFVLQGSCCEVLPKVRRGTAPGTAPFPQKML